MFLPLFMILEALKYWNILLERFESTVYYALKHHELNIKVDVCCSNVFISTPTPHRMWNMQLVWDDEQIQIMYDKFLYHTSWSLYSYPIHYPSEDFPTC